MTEAEWLVCGDPKVLFDRLVSIASERKLQLWACACCRRIWRLITDERSRLAIEVVEQRADGLMGQLNPDEVWWAAFRAANEAFDACESAVPDGAVVDGHTEHEYCVNGSAAASACSEVGDMPGRAGHGRSRFLNVARHAVRAVGHAADPLVVWPIFWRQRGDGPTVAEEASQATLLRDIFPFRPVAFSPDWRTDTALILARQMYESREFSAMPILADALQDAGCDSDDILLHCRDVNQVHVRGCWVVDLMLGKA